MRSSLLFTLALGTTLVQASTVLLPRDIGDLCKAPEGDGICQDVADCDGIEQPDSGCANAGGAECCISAACNTSGGEEGLCRRVEQGCEGGSFLPDDECPGSTLCCVKSEPEIEARASCSKPKANTCTFYRSCLEKKLNCGAKGYPLGYGEHYCKKFTAARSRLSPRGKAWVTKTMLCLQKALVPYATGAKKGTCAQVKSFAFGTHPNCYVKSGVCILGKSDWQVIVSTVGIGELFSSKDAFIATLKTVKGCKDFYIWLIKKGLVKMAKAIWDVTKDLGNWLKDKGKDIWDGITGGWWKL